MFIDNLNLILNVMKTERECVSRNCDRDCAKCDLVMDSDSILLTYDEIINHLTPVKPIENVSFMKSKHTCLCGNCGNTLRSTAIYCDKCGRPIKKENGGK